MVDERDSFASERFVLRFPTNSDVTGEAIAESRNERVGFPIQVPPKMAFGFALLSFVDEFRPLSRLTFELARAVFRVASTRSLATVGPEAHGRSTTSGGTRGRHRL